MATNPTIVAVGTVAAVSGSTITVPVPAAMSNGNLMVMIVSWKSNGAFVPSVTGWTLIDGQVGTGSHDGLATFYRTASSEPASYDVTGFPIAAAWGNITAFGGTAGLGNFAGIAGNGFSSAITPPTITASANSLILYAFGLDGTPTITSPGAPVVTDYDGSGNYMDFEESHEFTSATGTTTSRSWTATNGGYYPSATIEILGGSVVAINSKVKTWDGAAWQSKPVKVWDGTAWIQKQVKVWDGTAWKLE